MTRSASRGTTRWRIHGAVRPAAPERLTRCASTCRRATANARRLPGACAGAGRDRYRGSVWLRSQDFAGRLTAALEQDRTGGDLYATADPTRSPRRGRGSSIRFTLRPSRADPLARLAITARPAGVGLDRPGVA